MSEENEEVARRPIDAFNRGGVDALDPFWHEDIEFHDIAAVPDAGVHRGRTAAKGALQSTLDLTDKVAIEVLEMAIAGDEVLYRWRFQARGTASGVPIDATIFHVATIRNGKVMRLRQFLDRDQAFEAAGLEE
jgi:ketosteroid isomerase-like protein